MEEREAEVYRQTFIRTMSLAPLGTEPALAAWRKKRYSPGDAQPLAREKSAAWTAGGLNDEP
jgi:hypothetical protein